MQVKSHPNNVVIAMKPPYVESQSSEELENATLGKNNVTDKVSSMTIVKHWAEVCIFFFLSKKVAVLGFQDRICTW